MSCAVPLLQHLTKILFSVLWCHVKLQTSWKHFIIAHFHECTPPQKQPFFPYMYTNPVTFSPLPSVFTNHVTTSILTPWHQCTFISFLWKEKIAKLLDIPTFNFNLRNSCTVYHYADWTLIRTNNTDCPTVHSPSIFPTCKMANIWIILLNANTDIIELGHICLIIL